MISPRNVDNEQADQVENTGPQTQTPNITFSVDRCHIPTVPQDEQNSQLYSLGIDIYEQSDFEKEVLYQVDKACGNTNIKNYEVTSAVLKAGKQGNNSEITSGETKNQNHDFKNHVREVSGINFGDCGLEETEMGRKIRMGEATPFGTCVSSNVSEMDALSNFERYFKTQVEADKKKRALKRKSHFTKLESSQDKVTKERKSTRRENSTVPKKRKKTKVGTELNFVMSNKEHTSGNKTTESSPTNESSCSEYCPSESEDVSDGDGNMYVSSNFKNIKKKQKIFCHDQEWKTDDSDWEYSDDEKLLKNKPKSMRKEEDDGDIDHYLKRISLWEKTNNQYEIETQVKDLNGGFKVALTVWNRLFNYQKIGVQWLWELHVQRCGGILGDEMGLGKTVQVIAFLSGLSISKLVSRHGSFKGLGPVLIVSPTTVMHQWIKELHFWWPQFRAALMHESGNFNGKRENLVKEIIKSKGILVTSYVSCVQQVGVLTKYLWHYVILDEGHKIRNPDSQITYAVKQLRTPHRLILSGSPMQNNLKELWSLFDFIFPGKLGTLPVFMSEFSVPITQGGYTNASQVQVATAYKCATVLKDTISPYLLRRVKEDVKSHINLPMKNEQILFCKLTDEQRNLYLDYLNSSEVDSILSGRYKIFVGLINLRKICNHPHLYSGGPKLFKWDEVDNTPEEERYGCWKKAGKMIVVETLLKIWKRQDHRVLIFTQSKQMLRILESFVKLQGYEYLKLDGSTSIGSRQPIIKKFNEDKKYFLFLSTTQVGGLGVNLTGADRVVIYDPDWNPATDTQARERAWRIGQKNQVTIYRLVTSGTIEEKIYHRQIFKQFLTNKVLKDPKQRRFFKSNDLYELFTLKDTEGGTETSALFAGSGSEVNLKRISREIKLKDKVPLKGNNKTTDATSILGKEKIERMKQLARLLSEKIRNDTAASSASSNKTKITNDKTELSSSNHENKPKSVHSVERKNPPISDKKPSGNKSHRRRRKKTCFDTFEGELVPHLMSKLDYKGCKSLENEYKKEQDDYILGKLFSKSGIKTAMQHDRIMEEGPADYALVEGEAEKVAKEAVRALKESRRHYFQSTDSPKVTTGPRFGAKSKKSAFGRCAAHDKKSENDKIMSSSELLSRMKERNRLLGPPDIVTPTEYSDERMELLTDIRNFISYEAGVNNMASTHEIIDRFRNRLPAGTSPLFKALLLEICEFHRNAEGKGIWRLRPDFRW